MIIIHYPEKFGYLGDDYSEGEQLYMYLYFTLVTVS